MNLAELQALVQRGESETLEFKRTTGQLREGMQTVCALLNGPLGGFVLFGVKDGGEIHGQDVSTKTHEDLANELRKIEPPIFPDIETIALENGRSVIAIRVSGTNSVYTYDGRPYERRGPTTSRMSREQFERLLLERVHAAQRWENQPAHSLEIDDLDHAEIRRTIDEAIRRQRMEDPGTRDVEEILLGLGLIHHGQLLNAAAVLFGRPDRLFPHYPQCLIRLARFRGNDKSEFLDNRQEIGNAFQLFVRAQRFLRDHLPVAGRVLPNVFERVDDPLYPPEALREALANAFCHREYSVGGGAVNVAIYDNRLEIASTGTLPFGLTPEDLTKPHQSRPWNPLIAQVFYRRGIIETWGRGTLKMAELTSQAGLAPPEFESAGGEVVVRFWPTRYVPPTRISHDLSPLQREVLEILARTGAISLRNIMGQLSVDTPRRTIQDNLQTLRSLDLAESQGRGVGATWALKGIDSPSGDQEN